jgi:Phage uncharacterised protein (Phage_XkdX)
LDWFSLAERDYKIYQDNARIKAYVQNNKITPEQYLDITGEAYVA